METTSKVQYEAPSSQVVELKTDACIMQYSQSDYPYDELL